MTCFADLFGNEQIYEFEHWTSWICFGCIFLFYVFGSFSKLLFSDWLFISLYRRQSSAKRSTYDL